ncbi:hypothetical protein AAFC00_000247 [Neodothiora populina]|uniref:cellulase n=1 Tax=Neodothiora populina TaxID=2781224 RepID=A0ABR3P240_9PEZI
MKASVLALATAAGSAYAAQAQAYAQCGGSGWAGATECAQGWHCQAQNPYYSQCVAGAASGVASSAAPATTLATKTAPASSTHTSVVKASSVAQSKAPATSVVAASHVASSSVASSSAVVVHTSAASSTISVARTSVAATKPAASASASAGKVNYAGVNIAGFDFGCSTDGTCSSGGQVDPGDKGKTQMQHFVTDDGLNAFRLTVGWQYLVNSQLGGTLDATNFAAYDALVSNCLAVAEMCIVSIHNYARWNGQIIGQSGGSVTNAQFTSLWSQLATKYASKPKVAFGLMNEPHDVPDITTWASTVQEAVTAIRKAGATDNLILLPGNDWTHAASFVSDGSAAALNKVTNIDGTTKNIAFDVHQYLDGDGSGTSTSCSSSHASDFESLATWLRSNGRQAMLTEIGGGASDSSCLQMVCEALQTLMKNSDVYLGWTGWAAGSFDSSYALSETPNGSTDQQLVTKCIAGVFNA